MPEYETRPYLKKSTARLLRRVENWARQQDEETRFTNAYGQVTHDKIIREALRNLQQDLNI